MKIEQHIVIMSIEPTTFPVLGFLGSRTQNGFNDVLATCLVELVIVNRRSGMPVFARQFWRRLVPYTDWLGDIPGMLPEPGCGAGYEVRSKLRRSL